MSATALIGLGANLDGPAGAPPATLSAAIGALDTLPRTRLTGRSRVFRSDPVDAAGPVYLNQVVRLQTQLAPAELLDGLQRIETRFGRRRSVRNAPRSLDLDLLLYDDRRITDERLTVPHPRLHERLFVLMPLADIDPDLRIPGHGTVGDEIATVRATTSQRCTPLG